MKKYNIKIIMKKFVSFYFTTTLLFTSLMASHFSLANPNSASGVNPFGESSEFTPVRSESFSDMRAYFILQHNVVTNCGIGNMYADINVNEVQSQACFSFLVDFDQMIKRYSFNEDIFAKLSIQKITLLIGNDFRLKAQTDTSHNEMNSTHIHINIDEPDCLHNLFKEFGVF